MSDDAEDPRRAVERTLTHYQNRADAFWEGTRDHDVSQNIEALLRHIRAEAPFAILDFGCGPGRDLADFTRRGHRVIGLEGAAALAQMAREHSGCEVWEQDFLKLDLPVGRFDGVFANASLFHVPVRELPRVLRQIHAVLKPAGVLFSSNPRGDNHHQHCAQPQHARPANTVSVERHPQRDYCVADHGQRQQSPNLHFAPAQRRKVEHENDRQRTKGKEAQAA